MASTVAGPNGTSVRQSTRQTRTNPSRVSKTAGRTSLAQQYNPATAFSHSSALPMMGGGGSFSSASGVPGATGVGGAGGVQHGVHGAGTVGGMSHDVYPGITHFTDTMFAIPRELRRHESLFKEVDGKSWALEEKLPAVLGEIGKRIMEPAKNGVRPAEEETAFGKGTTPQGEIPEVTARRKLCLDIRTILSDLLPTMDEKNHVARNANKELRKQMLRLETAYAYVQNEISEDTRMGNLHHWAYSNKATAKAAGSERPRREAANRDRHNEDAIGTRKQRRNQADHDDDTRARKGPGRGRTAETVDTGAATKRRRVEKTQPAATSATMERTASTNTTSGRGGAKDTDTAKRRNRGPNAAAATTAQRKRTNTVTSAAGSPSVAPSPLLAAVGTAGKAASPAPSVAQRPTSSRVQANTTNGRQRPSSSASNRPPKKQSEGKGAHHKDLGITDSGLNGRPASKSRDTTKREDLKVITKTEAGQISETLPTPSRARSSKTSTPVVSTFAESGQLPTTQRNRPTRSTEGAGGPGKRSHKKGASTVSAARQAAAAAADEEDISHHGDDEDEEGEPRYCYCNQVSFGEMVACDNDACPREWFHLMCVGLAKPPLKNETWYCNECKDTVEAAKKAKSRGGR